MEDDRDELEAAGGELAGLVDLPDPDACRIDGASGTPVVLADGGAWLLADGGLCNVLDDIRDRIFDASIKTGVVEMADVRFAAWKLLEANYGLSVDEGRALIFEADNAELTQAVARSLFGPTGVRRSYTAWAASALRANGLDPAAFDGQVRADVLDHLVETGRAIPVDQFCDATRELEAWNDLRAFIKPTVPA